ncbi:MAG: ABC transporter permease [Actinomycetaceae bacterium]|nr:ABC transporter permease [Actinomycetaceae bacterium]MDY5855161.1 ABC transporter permease [Arcanobacterium sp.]
MDTTDSSLPKRDVTVQTSGLRIIGARPPIFKYFKELWERRYFIWKESRSHAFGQIKNTVLGQLWLIIDPFLNAAVYYVIFGLLLRFSRGIDNFVGYLVVGVTCFALLNNQLLRPAGLIEQRKALIKSFNFPRASLVVSFCLQQLIDFLPTFIAMLLFLMVVPPHSVPYWTWLLAPVVIILSLPMGLGLAFLSSSFTFLFPDFKFIWPLISRFWLYGSAIFWSIDMFSAESIARPIMHINPGWEFLELLRQLLVYNSWPPLWIWLAFIGWSLGIFLVGFVMFWFNEEKYGLQK